MFHLAPFQAFQILGIDHSIADSHGVLPGPLLDFLVHFGYPFGVHGPQTAFALVSIGGRFLDFLKAFVQGQVVTHTVLPAAGRGLEVREVLAHKAIDFGDWQGAAAGVLQSHGDQAGVGVGWFGILGFDGSVLDLLMQGFHGNGVAIAGVQSDGRESSGVDTSARGR